MRSMRRTVVALVVVAGAVLGVAPTAASAGPVCGKGYHLNHWFPNPRCVVNLGHPRER